MHNEEKILEKQEYIKTGIIATIQTYNNGGNLYRQYNKAKVAYQDELWMVLTINKTRVSESGGQTWTNKEPSLWFFPKKNYFFNIIATKRDQNFYYYINLASPFVFEDETIKYIDYEIDIKISVNKIVKIVDFHEYENNSKKFNYSQELKDKLYKSILIVTKMINQNHFIFDNTKLKAFIKNNSILLK